MPFNGLSLFLRPIAQADHTSMVVSMPFNGLSLFLPFTNNEDVLITHVYQCPLTGFLYFYNMLDIAIVVVLMYQCPLTGFLYFYER